MCPSSPWPYSFTKCSRGPSSRAADGRNLACRCCPQPRHPPDSKSEGIGKKCAPHGMSWGTSEHTWIARATNHPARPGLSLQSHRGSRDQQKDEGLQGLRRLRCPQQGQAPGPPLLVGILGGLSPPAQPLSHGNKPLTAGIASSWPHSPTRGRGGGGRGVISMCGRQRGGHGGGSWQHPPWHLWHRLPPAPLSAFHAGKLEEKGKNPQPGNCP